MSYTLSRLLSAATATYATYLAANPDQLASALEVTGRQAEATRTLAYAYAVRDLPVSAVGVLASSPAAVTSAMVLRVAFDVSDAALLSTVARSEEAQRKVLMVTLGWAAANAVALLVDRRRHRKATRRAADDELVVLDERLP